MPLQSRALLFEHQHGAVGGVVPLLQIVAGVDRETRDDAGRRLSSLSRVEAGTRATHMAGGGCESVTEPPRAAEPVACGRGSPRRSARIDAAQPAVGVA